MKVKPQVVSRVARVEQGAIRGDSWDNESGPEGALTPLPGLTPHHSTQPRSAG